MACSRRELDFEFELAGRSNFLRIDLDVILNNIRTLRKNCAKHTEVLAVIKANAYGHGSVGLARHLSSHGVHYFGVATCYEGQELRQAGVRGFIQVFGNCVAEEVAVMRQYQLTPTATSETFLRQWDAWPHSKQVQAPAVVIKVDTGMSRNGCQPHELPALMQLCEDLHIPVHSLMTHFAQAWDDHKFTKQQLDTFLEAVKPYRNKGIKLQAANSAAIIRGFATDLDLVRPGICLYGLPPDTSKETVKVIQDFGLRPALSWIARPNMVKLLPAGRHVGYDQTYVLDKEETIATIAVGYADGYNRKLSATGVLTSIAGEKQPVVGRVSMDAVTVAVKMDTTVDTPFHVYAADLTSPNSVTAVARALGTIPYEVGTSLSVRLPRIYCAGNLKFTADGKVVTVPESEPSKLNGQGGTNGTHRESGV